MTGAVELNWWFPWDGQNHSTEGCRVYWGSHGCKFEPGHDGPHECDCCECDEHLGIELDPDSGCVAKPPYYGAETHFYGEDAPK